MKQIYDVLDRTVDATNFFISVDVSGTPDTPPPATQIARFINSHVKNLDLHGLAELYNRDGIDAIQPWEFRHGAWSIHFRPIPKKPEARGRPGARPLGAFSSGVRWLNHHTPMRDAIVAKAGAYGQLPNPLVVAINSLEPIQDYDIFSALFGEEKYIIHFDEQAPQPRQPEPFRERNGVWTGPEGPARQGLSGVLIASHLTPWSLGVARFALFHNPWATQSVSVVPGNIEEHVPENDHFRIVAGRPISDLLGLPWPLEKAD